MGRLQLLSICAIVLYGSVVMAGLSVQQKELERAAELAVERAAEKAAERAVEKALNSGNSSTVTVTVKESYSNAMKTAEEQAAPGSESTRPYDSKIYDRQYAYSPPSQYANDSAEAEELGISKESLNSSVENAGAANLGPSSAESAEADRSGESSSQPPEGNASEGGYDEGKENPDPPAPTAVIPGFDVSTNPGLAFSSAGDFSTLDTALDDVSSSVVGGTEPGFKGDFGLKSRTKTFSSSYSKNKDDDFSGTKVVDVDDEEDAEIFKMYAADFGDGGWTSAKQKGWVRHRPLWDDTKSRDNNKDFWTEDFSDISAGETQNKDSHKVQPPLTPTSPSAHSQGELPTQKTSQVVKRMVDHYSETNRNQLAVPLATLSLDPKTPAALYKLLQREVKLPLNGYDRRLPMPMKVYVTIPVPYLPSYGIHKRGSSSSYVNNRKNDGLSFGSSKNGDYDYSKETEPNRYELAVPPNPYNDEMNEEPYPTSTEPIKRSFHVDNEEEEQEEGRKNKDASSVTGGTDRNKTLIIVPGVDSNSGEKRKQSEVAVGQPHPFQVNTPLKLFDIKRPETEVPLTTA